MNLAVVKQGPKCEIQLAYLDRLASVASDRVPEIIARWHHGFAMEMLTPCEPTAWWPVTAERAAAGSFWNHDPVATLYSGEWQDNLRRTLDIAAPEWTWRGLRECTTHGDLTLCNTMFREETMVFVDPVWPERVPQIAQIDQARIVQTMMGWEIMTGYQSELIVWDEPSFLYTSPIWIRVLAFWTYVMMARIAASVSVTEDERSWAKHIRDEIWRHVNEH